MAQRAATKTTTTNATTILLYFTIISQNNKYFSLAFPPDFLISQLFVEGKRHLSSYSNNNTRVTEKLLPHLPALQKQVSRGEGEKEGNDTKREGEGKRDIYMY